MMQTNKKEKELIEGYKAFVKKNGRIPSIRELGESIGWKKSITNKYLERLIGRGVFEKEEGVSKSLKLVENKK